MAASQTIAGIIPDAIQELNNCFAEDTIRVSYAEPYWTKEIHQEGMEKRDTSHAQLVSKTQAQIKEEKDEKKRKPLEAKMTNVQGSFVSHLARTPAWLGAWTRRRGSTRATGPCAKTRRRVNPLMEPWLPSRVCLLYTSPSPRD